MECFYVRNLGPWVYFGVEGGVARVRREMVTGHAAIQVQVWCGFRQ